MYHQDYIHTEQTLSAKDVSRAGRQQDMHTGTANTIGDQQIHKKQAINVYMTGANNVILKVLQLYNSLKVHAISCCPSSSATVGLDIELKDVNTVQG